ncbi:hypothetical protein KR093_002854 [Drosophila rubida]|uniref:Serpin domain-containing protein n=1 Tax=Drosophila rubida TaxID=30044 RepID=A0AAD4JZQ4_9MUSC|nr:hypothetical protein KR093_002854 [Drosophila rubida]
MQLLGNVTVAFGLVLLLSTGYIQWTEGAAYSRRSANANANKVDVEMSDAIARKVLSFTVDIKNQVTTPVTVIYSPVSIMSALAIIMSSRRQTRLANLTELFGQIDVEKMHQQFGLMLKDMAQPTKDTISPLRQFDPWRREGISESIFRQSSRTNGSQKVRLANALFLQLGNKLKLLKRHDITVNYHPDILHVDFNRRPMESINTINAWVDLQTNDHVDEMLKTSFEPETERVFVTVLTFKANWEIDFMTGSSKFNYFYPNGTENPITAPMMIATGDYPYYLSEELGCHIIGIPYQGEMTTMYMIKPFNSTKEVLNAFHENLTADHIEDLILNMKRRSGVVVLPKMNFEVSLILRTPLEGMGLSSIFDPIYSFTNQKAAMRGSKSTKVPGALTVTQIFQKVQLRVDEKGTQ